LQNQFHLVSLFNLFPAPKAQMAHRGSKRHVRLDEVMHAGIAITTA
jgi:hypothetical protein